MYSIKTILAMDSREIQQLSKGEFGKFTARDLAMFNSEQFIVISEKYFDEVKPTMFRMVDPKLISKRMERYGTSETKWNYYDKAIQEAKKEQKKLWNVEQHRRGELKIVRNESGRSYVTVDCVAARLSVTLRYVLKLSEEGVFSVIKIMNKNMIEVTQVCDFLIKQLHEKEGTFLNDDPIPVLFKPQELAVYFSRDPRTLARIIREKGIPHFRIGNRVRVRMEDLVELARD